MEWSFRTPERKTAPDGTTLYEVILQTPLRTQTTIEYDGEALVPNIQLQNELEPIVQSLLSAIAQSPTLFRTPPTFKSLQAITPVWGAVVQNGALRWNLAGGKLPELPSEWVGRRATLHFLLKGLQITRSSILPLWGLTHIQAIAPPPDLIDFTFDGAGAGLDTRSVVSSDSIETDTENIVFELHDANKEKRLAKAHVRELLRRALEARMAADGALDRFFEEYDLSDGESDFSDADD